MGLAYALALTAFVLALLAFLGHASESSGVLVEQAHTRAALATIAVQGTLLALYPTSTSRPCRAVLPQYGGC